MRVSEVTLAALAAFSDVILATCYDNCMHAIQFEEGSGMFNKKVFGVYLHLRPLS